jgi:hypothetical protein
VYKEVSWEHTVYFIYARVSEQIISFIALTAIHSLHRRAQ